MKICSECGRTVLVFGLSKRIKTEKGIGWWNLCIPCADAYKASLKKQVEDGTGEKCHCKVCGEPREPFDWGVGYIRPGLGTCFRCFTEGVGRMVEIIKVSPHGPAKALLVTKTTSGGIFSERAKELAEGAVVTDEEFESAMNQLTSEPPLVSEMVFSCLTGGQK